MNDSSTTAATSGFDGAVNFGGFGGLTFGAREKARDNPIVWIAGIAAVAFVALALKKK